MLEKADSLKSKPLDQAAPETPAEAESIAPPKYGLGAKLLLLLAVLILFGGIYYGIRARTEAETILSSETLESAVPIVNVVLPEANAPDQALILPGQTVAFSDTPIYARASGYLKHWHVSMGDHVKKGDLLAEIETPELDAQLRQARADLATAEANAKLASITARRTEDLLKSASVSTQQRDNAAGAYAANQAMVNSREADVARLEELQSYEKIYAPFDGVITARNTDIGALITAGTGTPDHELFHIQATKVLRIYVAVPEIYAPSIHPGATPSVTLDEYPGQSFPGKLVRTDRAINQNSRTLLAEVDVDNSDEELLPGAYTFVHFSLPGRQGSVTVPSNTLLFRSEGLRVGVVRDDEAELVPIKIGRDYGDRVEVISGLTTQDKVILNPSDSLLSGAKVRVNGSEKAPGAS